MMIYIYYLHQNQISKQRKLKSLQTKQQNKHSKKSNSFTNYTSPHYPSFHFLYHTNMNTHQIFEDKPPEHVSLLARDIAGNFVHHRLTEKQLSRIAKKLEPKKGKDYGTHHAAHSHERAEDGRISVEHLRKLLDHEQVDATHAELRALAAVLSATNSDHFSVADNTASRLRELANEPHLHVWSSEEWHTALKQERKKASEKARHTEYQLLLHKERVKLHRLANVKKKSGKIKDNAFDVHEKARKHLAKVERKRRKIFEKKWKRVEKNKSNAKKHKKKMEKEGHVHINFERLLFRLRQGKIDVPRLEEECEREREKRKADVGDSEEENGQEGSPGILCKAAFYDILQSCCVGTKITSKEFQRISDILDPDETGNVSYEDFLWALKRQRGNNGFTLELPQFIPVDYTVYLDPNLSNSNATEMLLRDGLDNATDTDGTKTSSAKSSRRSSRASTPSALTAGITVIGIVQAAGIKRATTNTRVHISVGNTERTTGIRWRSDCPTYNELWTGSSEGESKIQVSLVECANGNGSSGSSSSGIKVLGACTVPIRAPNPRDGVFVDDRWYPIVRKGQQHHLGENISLTSTSTSQTFGSMNYQSNNNNKNNSNNNNDTSSGDGNSNDRMANTNSEIRVITCVLPTKIPSSLAAERPGHHSLGRVQWRSNSQMPLQHGMAFIFQGVLVLTAEPETYDLEGVGMEMSEGLFVVDAFPLWGCSKADAIETTVREKIDDDDDDDDEYGDDDFEDDNDDDNNTANKTKLLQNHVEMKTVSLSGVVATLAVRTASASGNDGIGALVTELELFPSDMSVPRLLRVMDAASEHYRPRGGWCVPNGLGSLNTMKGDYTMSGSRSFSCMLVEEDMTKWPGSLRVSRDVITFSSTDSPLGNMSVEIEMSNVLDVKLTGQNVMPPTNALTITVVDRINNEQSNGKSWKQTNHNLAQTFTTFPSAGLALQCILENVIEYNQIRFEESELKRRNKQGVIFPGVILSPSLKNQAVASPTSDRTTIEVTPKGFSKIDNFYHDTLLTEGHHFGPKGRHSPVVKRVLGLVIVDNLEPSKPTPPSSSVRRAGSKSPRRRRQQEQSTTTPMHATPGGNTTHRKNKRSKQQRNRSNIHWTKEIKILSLLDFTSGSGRPFTQLVRHIPSKHIFALHVIPSQTQNMFELARQAVVALRVDHPNICRCYGTTQVGESIQFLWERGPSTINTHIQRAHIEEGKAPTQSQKWMVELIRALSHLHSVGIVHRDVLTQNIMIMRDGSLRLNSFGISKYLAKARTTTICGEPTNMAPERVLGRPHGFGVDWWSVGLVMHEMYSGTPLFPLKVNARHNYKEEKINNGNGMGIYERIVGCRYQVANNVDPALADCIRRLVSHEIHRLGVCGIDREGSCGAEVLLYMSTRNWWDEEE